MVQDDDDGCEEFSEDVDYINQLCHCLMSSTGLWLDMGSCDPVEYHQYCVVGVAYISVG